MSDWQQDVETLDILLTWVPDAERLQDGREALDRLASANERIAELARRLEAAREALTRIYEWRGFRHSGEVRTFARTAARAAKTVRDTVTEWWETKPYEPGNPFFDLAELARRLERAEEEIARYKIGVGPDDPAGCPAGHGDQCCGWHDACRAALRAAEGADE